MRAAEHDRFGFAFDRRVGRFAEALEIIVPLLRSGSVDFAGEFYIVRGAELRPRLPGTERFAHVLAALR